MQELRDSQEKVAEEAENSRQAAAQAAKDAAEDAAFYYANPGDYVCPHCRFITLRKYSSRCPKCHGTIGPGHWQNIDEQERREAIEYAERARLAEIAQKAQHEEDRKRYLAKAAEEKRIKEEREAAYKALPWWVKLSPGTRGNILVLYFFYILPAVQTVALARWGLKEPITSSWDLFWVFCPFVNVFSGYAVTLMANKPVANFTLLIFLAFGAVIYMATKPVKIDT